MRVVPVVLQSSILAGALLFPVAGLLAAAALEGSYGLRLVGVVLVAASLYATVVWIFARRRETEELAATTAAPADARLQSLGRTTLAVLPGPLLLVAASVLAVAFDLLIAPLLVAAGIGLAQARVALRYAAWERSHPGRLVRDPDNVLRTF